MVVLVTLNTWKCDGDYDARLRAMAAGLAALHADVVCLQECFAVLDDASADSAGTPADTARALAQHLGMQSFHVPARRKRRAFAGGQVFSSSGLAILTRLEAHGMEALALPTDSADGERIAQSLLLRADGATLRVINTHLSHLRSAGPLRAAQVAAVLAYWCEGPSHAGVPIVLAGDLNATIDAPELAALRLRPDLDLGPVPPDAWPSTLLDAPPARPRAIDHVLLLRGAVTPAPRITARIRALHQPDSRGLYPSDHAAAVATVELA